MQASNTEREKNLRVAVVSKRLNQETLTSIEGMTFIASSSVEEGLKSYSDVILVDDIDVHKNFNSDIKFLVVGKSSKEKVLRYINCSSFSGFVSPDMSSELMCKAIRMAKEGEMWVDRKCISMVFDEFSRRLRKMQYNVDLFNVLSDRETEILRLISKGFSNKDIAKTLFISERTVKTHAYNTYKKLGVDRRTKAISLLFLEEH